MRKLTILPKDLRADQIKLTCIEEKMFTGFIAAVWIIFSTGSTSQKSVKDFVVFPGHFLWTVSIGIWSWWDDLWRRGAEDSFQERRPHGYPWKLIFIPYNSIAPFTCIHVLATSLCLGANDGRFMRSGHEEISTGFESKSQIRLQKAIVRRGLARFSKCRDCQERSPFVPVLSGAAPCWDGLLMRVTLWLLRRDLQYGSSFDPDCTFFLWYRQLYCRSCFYEHKCQRHQLVFIKCLLR